MKANDRGPLWEYRQYVDSLPLDPCRVLLLVAWCALISAFVGMTVWRSAHPLGRCYVATIDGRPARVCEIQPTIIRF